MSEATTLKDPENVARRYSHRPGCRFVGWREVGIAMFAMQVRVVVLEPRAIPPIDEFLLRSLSLSVRDPGEMAKLFGLDQRTVENRLVELRRGELIDVDGDSSDERVQCRLTSKGQEVARTLERTELVEETIGVVFHGFLRRPMLIAPESLLRPHELRDRDLHPIRALPNRNPRPDEIELSELSKVLRAWWRKRRKGNPPELISVQSVLKGVKTLYQPGVMLQYELRGLRKQQQIAFAVDGVLDDDYERGFADCNGIDRLPDLLFRDFKTTKDLVSEFIPPHLTQKLGRVDQIDEIAEQVEVASADVEVKEAELAHADRPDTRQLLRGEIEELRKQLADLEQSRDRYPIRRLRTFECDKVLGESLDNVRQRLVIVSAFLSTDVVNRFFLQKLENALKRGVEVWIAYGLGEKAGQNQRDRMKSRSWTDAEKGLVDLSKSYDDRFRLKNLGNTHEKILIRDSDFAVSGSYNWLSFRPTPKKSKYRHEDALLVTEPSVIEEYFAEITARFSSCQP